MCILFINMYVRLRLIYAIFDITLTVCEMKKLYIKTLRLMQQNKQIE